MSDHQTLLCRYHYDPLDRLAGQVSAGETDTRLFYQKSRLTTQVQGELSCSVLQFDEQLLAQQRSSGKPVEATLLATDQQRSILQSIGDGQREASAYTAYGHLVMSSGLSCFLGFDGERRDPVTGHYLLGNGYRAFNPVMMRFNSPDSVSPFGEGGLNAYAYCKGDPINLRDPAGHAPFYSILKGTKKSFMEHVPRHMKQQRLGVATSAKPSVRPVLSPVASNRVQALVDLPSRSSGVSERALASDSSRHIASSSSLPPIRHTGLGGAESAHGLVYFERSVWASLDEKSLSAHLASNASAMRKYTKRAGSTSREALAVNLKYNRYNSDIYSSGYGGANTKSHSAMKKRYRKAAALNQRLLSELIRRS